MHFITRTALAGACLLGLAQGIQAGPVFDDILNYPVVDQRCPADKQDEGMGLASKGQAKFVQLKKEQPIGQTFTVGSSAVKLWRISLGICHWESSWQPGEAVTLTVWDSPKKSKRFYTRTLSYDQKWSKWDIAFDTHIPCKPNQKFYFELTHNGGGDNTIDIAYVPGNAYERGQAYVAGKPTNDFDLYFVAVTKPKRDRIANIKAFLDQFDYSYPPLAKAGEAYKKGNYDQACKLILQHWESRTEPDSLVPKPIPADKLDKAYVDPIVNENKLYNYDNRKDSIEIDDQTTWREVWPNSADYVGINDVPDTLGRAYQATGDEKYAKKLNQVMLDYIQDNTSPFDGGMRGGRWVAMHITWRLGDAWGGWGAACKSKSFTDDVKLGWIDYECKLAQFAMKEHSGGNHANAVGEGLMQWGKRFPEYKIAKDAFAFGFDKLVDNSLGLFCPDGACSEPTMNYHGYSLGNLMLGMDIARKYGLKVPEAIEKTTEKALAYTAYMLDPRGVIPSIGDTDCNDFRANINLWDGWRKGEALKAYQLYGRKDCLFIATAGKEGEKPPFESYCFPNIGHYILRSDWVAPKGETFDDARQLILRAGHYGSHGHWDLNSIILTAYDKPLLIDPGRTAYDNPLMPILASNKSHNVLLVDDLSMERAAPQVNAWRTTPVMDLVDCTYPGLYPGVDHRRAVVFVRPGYYVMFDNATSTQQHNYGLNFWLTPPEVTIDKATGSVHSNEPDGANILLKAVDPNGLDITERKGSLDLDRIRDDIPVITYWLNGKTGMNLATVLYPYPKGVGPVELRTSRKVSGAGQICRIETPEGIDYVMYSRGVQRTYLQDQAVFDGRSGLVRQDKQNNFTSFCLLDGTFVSIGTQTLAESMQPVQELSVKYLADRVEVTCPKANATLKIASLGRTKAVVNGTEIAISGATFSPF